MRGNNPTLREYILDLHPEPIDLFCYEQLCDSSDEDEIGLDRPDGQAQPATANYYIVTCCYTCDTTVRLCINSTTTDVRTLQQLLMGTCTIVCPSCAQQ
uniref:Protein E7 n=1 Tax=Human papillomavirus 58 TaxID=10598 RepID=A0A192YG58_HPV58|nr:E7 [human papillomavirus 58]